MYHLAEHNRQAEPWDIERGVRVCIMMPGKRVRCGKVTRVLKSGWGAAIAVDGRTVTRDVGDIAVLLDEHGNVLHNPGKKWIQGALGTKRRRLGKGAHHRKAVRVEAAHKGALHRALHVPMGRPIPLAKERAAAKRGGKVGKQARLALTLRKLGRKGKRR